MSLRMMSLRMMMNQDDDSLLCSVMCYVQKLLSLLCYVMCYA